MKHWTKNLGVETFEVLQNINHFVAVRSMNEERIHGSRCCIGCRGRRLKEVDSVGFRGGLIRLLALWLSDGSTHLQ